MGYVLPSFKMEPVLLVLLFGSLAAGSAALGALPFAGGRRPGPAWIGSAYALAGGAMLGVGYLLMSRGLAEATLPVVLGAVAGVAYTRWVQSYAGLDDLDDRADLPAPYSYKFILQDTLHASAEGVAIGVAMALELELGIFLAVALAIHNVGEAMALTDVLRGRPAADTAPTTVGESAGLAVVTNVTQPLMAVVAFAISPALGALFPAFVGFAAAALVFLTLTDLVPASYQRADARLVALLVSVAAAVVVLLQAVFLGEPV